MDGQAVEREGGGGDAAFFVVMLRRRVVLPVGSEWERARGGGASGSVRVFASPLRLLLRLLTANDAAGGEWSILLLFH